MQSSKFCGLDFGTSNSSLGIIKNNIPHLVALEGDKETIPSAIFYNIEDDDKNPVLSFGRDAIDYYAKGYEGRLMRSFKSLLGTSLINEKTQIGQKNIAFDDILSAFVKHLKTQAETQCGHNIDSVVCGRPVFFVDNDSEADKKAQDFLENILRKQGFKNILFQYEPVAAALDYEQTITDEHLALIVDLGGGTSDFSVVRASPQAHKRPDRTSDILSTQGVHIGGNDFDRILSLKSVMPHLGYGTMMRSDFDDKTLELPMSYFHDLATWQKINFLYGDAVMRSILTIYRHCLSPDLVNRLIILLKNHDGHRLALAIENMKIDLTSTDTTHLNLGFIEKDFCIEFNKTLLDNTLIAQIDALKAALYTTLKSGGVTPEQIDTVFLAGGSTAIPAVRSALTGCVPHAHIIEGNRFGSIGIGLTLDAQKHFSS